MNPKRSNRKRAAAWLINGLVIFLLVSLLGKIAERLQLSEIITAVFIFCFLLAVFLIWEKVEAFLEDRGHWLVAWTKMT